MHRFNKALSVGLAVLMTCSSFSVLASASDNFAFKTEGEYKYEDSTGSVASDFTTNGDPTGKDKTQGMESAYKHPLVDENSTILDEFLEETEVYATVAPSFGIKIPKTLILNSSGLAEYDIGVKGDLAGTQKLTVRPVDKIEDSDAIDFYMSEQNAFIGAKDDIVATVDQIKTMWTWSEIEKSEYTWLQDAGEISAPDISAGSWAGTFDFAINMEIFEATNSSYFALYSPEIDELLTDNIEETPAVWEKTEINSSDDQNEMIGDIVNTKMQYGVSYYAAVILSIISPEDDPAILTAAQESDAALDAYFNATYLESLKAEVGDTTSTNVDELFKNALGYTAHEMADQTVIFLCDSAIEASKEYMESYDLSLYTAMMLAIAGVDDDETIAIAKQYDSDRTALDTIYNQNFLPLMKEELGIPEEAGVNCFNDIFILMYGFSADDIVNYYENGIVPISGTIIKVPTQPVYYKGSDSSTAFTFTVTEAQDITFGIQSQYYAVTGISFVSNPTKSNLKSMSKQPYSLEAIEIVKEYYPGMTTYTAIGTILLTNGDLPRDIQEGIVNAAQQGNAAFDAYYVANVKPILEEAFDESLGISLDSFEGLWNYSQECTLDEWIKYCDEGIVPENFGMDFFFNGDSASYSDYVSTSYTKHFEPGTYTIYISSLYTGSSSSNYDRQRSNVVIKFPGDINVTQTEAYFPTNETNPWDGYTGEVYLAINEEYVNATRGPSRLPSELVLPTELFGYKITALKDGELRKYPNIEYLYIPSTYKTLTFAQIYECTAKEIVIRDNENLTTIPKFDNNTNLEIITLPGNIISLPDDAFRYCSNLKHVLNLSDNITTIPSGAFYECASLTSIDLSFIKEIEGRAFYNCDSLRSVNTSSLENIHYDETGMLFGAFAECNNLVSVDLSNVTSIGQRAFYNCTSLSNVDLTNVDKISSAAFYNTAIKEIDVSDKEFVGYNAFGECENLKTAVLGYNGLGVVTGSNNIESLTVPINQCGYKVEPGFKKLSYLRFTEECDGTNTSGLEYPWADSEAEELTVIIDAEVETISQGLFMDTKNLKEVSLPDSVTLISYDAFRNCSGLETIRLSNNLVSIYEDAFRDCINLKNIEFPSSLSGIYDGAFVNCKSLEKLDLSNTKVEKIYGSNGYIVGIRNEIEDINTTNIPNLFCYTKQRFVRSGETVGRYYYLTISDDGIDAVFRGCSNLKEVLLPNTLKQMEYYAFAECDKLESITLPVSATVKGEIGAKNIKEVNYTIGNQNGEWADTFNVEKIDSSFEICDLSIDDYLIYRSPFAENNVPFVVNLEDGITSISDGAFSDCKTLSEINIPNSITYIGSYAFNNCNSLNDIVLHDNIEHIGKLAFTNTGYYKNNDNWENGVLYINKCLISARKTINGGCVIKDGTNLIADNAFEDCNLITDLSIPDSIIEINDSILKSCTSLSTINVSDTHPNYLTDEYGVLYNKDMTRLIKCPPKSGITEYTIPSTVTEISDDAFSYCTDLEIIHIPDGVTYIGSCAFNGCSSLTSVEMPNSVTYLGEYAFYKCSNMENVIISENIAVLKDYTFSDCISLTEVTVPESVTLFEVGVFSGCDSLESAIVLGDLTYIAKYTFLSCESLQSFVAPSTVTWVGFGAFNGCKSLGTVKLPKGTTYEYDSFTGCKNLQLIYV